MTSPPILGFILALLALLVGAVLYLWRPKLRRWLLGFWALAVLLALFGPGLETLAWHLRNGDAVPYFGHQVPVPSRWTADAGPQGVIFDRLPISLLHSSYDPSTIIIFRLLVTSGHAARERVQWERLFRTMNSGPGFVTSGPQELDTLSGKAFCMQSSGKKLATASCLMLQGAWDVSFFGHKSEEGEFFKVVRGIR